MVFVSHTRSGMSVYLDGLDYNYIAAYHLLPKVCHAPYSLVRMNLCMIVVVYINSYLATFFVLFFESIQEYYADLQFAREYLRDKTDGVVLIHLSHLSPSSRVYDTGMDLHPSTAVQKASILFYICVHFD